jgi:hypothetical protein
MMWLKTFSGTIINRDILEDVLDLDSLDFRNDCCRLSYSKIKNVKRRSIVRQISIFGFLRISIVLYDSESIPLTVCLVFFVLLARTFYRIQSKDSFPPVGRTFIHKYRYLENDYVIIRYYGANREYRYLAFDI